jgi:hypothetical protein
MGDAVQTKTELLSLKNLVGDEVYYVIEEQTFYLYDKNSGEWLEYIEDEV